jgi:hypothetical protein
MFASSAGITVRNYGDSKLLEIETMAIMDA